MASAPLELRRGLGRLLRRATGRVPQRPGLAGRASDDATILQSLVREEAEHRLGNLLQLVITNLDRSARLLDGPARSALGAASHQVSMLGRLHRDLGRQHHDAECCGDQLLGLGAVLDALVLAPRGHTVKVSVDPELAAIRLPAEAGRCLRLIVVEVVINAAKHAFPAGRGGRITIGLCREGPHLSCSIVDDGTGQIGPATSGSSSGMRLIGALASQAGGRCRWVFAPSGTRVSITLPIGGPEADHLAAGFVRSRNALVEAGIGG